MWEPQNIARNPPSIQHPFFVAPFFFRQSRTVNPIRKLPVSHICEQRPSIVKGFLGKLVGMGY
jgi:hypothetical protein